jgi:hypothetical protein
MAMPLSEANGKAINTSTDYPVKQAICDAMEQAIQEVIGGDYKELIVISFVSLNGLAPWVRMSTTTYLLRRQSKWQAGELAMAMYQEVQLPVPLHLLILFVGIEWSTTLQRSIVWLNTVQLSCGKLGD